MPRKPNPWYRKSDGWWYIKINGKQQKLARGRENRQAAFDRWHELMAQRAANPPLDSDEHTVASIIDLHLTHGERSYTPDTLALHRFYLQSFAEAHGFRPVSKCIPMHLTNWLDSNPKWTSEWTRFGAIGIVQRAFNWASEQGVIAANPFRSIKRRKGEPRRPMADEEFLRLLRATVSRRRSGWKSNSPPLKRPTAGQRFRQLLFFLRYTGARPGEMAALKWADVDLERQVIVLRKHKTVTMQRTPKPRIIQLVPQVVRLLIRIRSQQSTNAEHVFQTARRTPWNRSNLGLRIRRLREKAGLPSDLKLYGIRHHFGTQSIVNGVDIKTLSELMGHTSTRMTEHYLHLAGRQEHLAAAMQQAVSPRPTT